MDFFVKGVNDDADCPFDEKAIQRCPFLRNINKPTCFSFSSMSFSAPVRGAKGPIFEDGPNFDTAFKLFHGKDGVVPLAERPQFHTSKLDPEPVPQFNPLASKAATISLSAFGPGGPFSFGPFSDKWKKQKKKSGSSSDKRETSSENGKSSNHEALGNEWLQTGNCPIAKSYRAVSGVLPLVAKALQPPTGMKLRCPPAVVAARAALARTAFVKTLRPQPLPSKMLVIALLGMAANVPLGVWREHTRKFSLSWFAAVHAAVPFIAMLRKSVVMPKTAMALTIGASILGQMIGSRAERLRLKASKERALVQTLVAADGTSRCGPGQADVRGSQFAAEGIARSSFQVEAGGPAPSSSLCC
ncbi:uncharacterized protein LOC116215459 [Punica granatum]|uniref:Uncharacterized protein n=2 Tax=Punica granatum TaxID=22663 RepID=A0A218W8B4_PUNGR|nr:uncharacterized protein LOC116215459 [Punica granatum]OWM68560.1 hypothetical protein CDL15_Pgr023525 [Punica granatum]PKI48372.1 hypothetical protein CRG98_031225 [Punica granatum]